MRKGKDLNLLAAEIMRQKEAKKDFIADTRDLTAVIVQEGTPHISISGHGRYEIGKVCHDQMATRYKIPRAYYEKMLQEGPVLWAVNLNHWMKRGQERRMIRTMDGRARAFLSDGYRRLENSDVAQAVLPIIAETGCHVESCELTERRMYLKCVNKKVEGEIKKGDVVQAGVVISNSEIGCGSVKIEPMVYRLVCSNGLISADHRMRKYHVGRRYDEDDTGEELLMDETRQAEDRAFFLKVRDLVKAALTQALFEQIVDKMKTAAGVPVKNPVKAVDVLAKRNYLTQEEGQSILGYLVDGGDLSVYGVVNAITRAAQDVVDYDRSTDFERLGGELLVDYGYILN